MAGNKGGRPEKTNDHQRIHPAIRITRLQEDLNESIEAFRSSSIQAFMPGGSVDQFAVAATATKLQDLVIAACTMYALLMQESRQPWMMLEKGDK